MTIIRKYNQQVAFMLVMAFMFMLLSKSIHIASRRVEHVDVVCTIDGNNVNAMQHCNHNSLLPIDNCQHHCLICAFAIFKFYIPYFDNAAFILPMHKYEYRQADFILLTNGYSCSSSRAPPMILT